VLSRREHDAWRRLVPGQNVVELPNGIDCAPYLKYEAQPARGPASRCAWSTSAGSRRPRALAETIEALALARSNGVAARLVIAG
jgi:hypothetical protein